MTQTVGLALPDSVYPVDRRTVSVAIDLNALKVASLEHYVDMLYQAKFDLDTTNQLIASMTSYEIPGRASLGLGECLKDFLSSKPAGNA